MATPQEVIKDLVGSLDTTTYRSTAALNQAVQAVSNYESWDEVINTMVKDCRAYAGDYKKFLSEMCDIVLDNEDTGAITGFDAGGGEIKTAESVVPEYGDWTYPEDTSFTIQGLTVNVPEQNTLSTAEQYIVGALYTWWIDEALTLSKESFGLSFENEGASVNSIDVNFYDKTDGKLAATNYSNGQKCNELVLNINMHYYDLIDTDNPNGYIDVSGIVYLDRTIAHEIVHAVMAANVDYFSNLPTNFKEGIAEIVHGIDDKRYNNLVKLASSYSQLRSAFSGSGASAYAAGYMALRYLAKQSSADRDPSVDIVVDNTDTDTGTTDTGITDTDTGTTDTETTTIDTVPTYSATFNSDSTELVVEGDFPNDIWLSEVNYLTGEASEYSNSSVITIDGGMVTTNIILAGNNNDNFIQAGSGGSSLWGGDSGNDTLIGGDGRDMFWFGAWCSNDVIENFTAGKDEDSDLINIYNNALSSISRDDEYLTLKMTDGSQLNVALSNDVDEAIQYSFDATNMLYTKIGNDNSDNYFTYESDIIYYQGGSGEDTLILTDDTGNNQIVLNDDYFANINIIDAENSSVDNLMAGNTLENTIIGGGGASSLWGGMYDVDDTLIGGSGENTFWYGITEGNDVIQNAKDEDKINLYDISMGDIISTEEIDGDIVLTTRLGSLTLKDGATPIMNFADGVSRRYDSENKTWNQT